MNTPPPDLDERVIIDALREGWGFPATAVEYAAVGFGSHHWIALDERGGRRFVTIDELSKGRMGNRIEVAFARLAAAFETACCLKLAGLEFVLASIRDNDGAALRRLSPGHSMAVFPFVPGDTAPFGEFRSDAEREQVEQLVARVHDATRVVADVALREGFVLPCRTDLDGALTELGAPWDMGPYAEQTRALLIRIEPELRRALAVYDGLVAEVVALDRTMVITHGEPHAGNVLWTMNGPLLLDWDTALIAPRGRDLWMFTERTPGEAVDVTLYRLWWDLAEIAGYVTGFREPHGTTDDTAESWKNLEHYAALGDHWGEELA